MADILIPVRVDASQLTKIDAMINDLRGKKINIKLDVDDRLLKIDQEINKLQAKKLKLGVDDKEARKKIDEQIKALRQKKAEIRVQARLDQSPLNRDLANLTQQKRELAIRAKMQFDYADYFKRIQGGMSRVGSTMMTAGNTLRRLTTPLESVLRGFAYGAGYQALNKVTEGMKSGFSRYDTMKKYPLMMAQFADASYSAEKSIKDLDMSVRGLPTSLDQIVDLSQRFTMSLGDMKKGTRLAIATNRAFLASMATDTQQYQGMMQLQDLMNGKKLNSREWMSLGASMGYAINEIGKVLGYKDPGKFRQALYANEIAGEKFLKALEKVGNEGGSVFEKAELAKQTWQAVSANIQNAFSRLGYNVLKALDEVFKIGTDKTFVQWTDELRDGIDKLSESFSGWLKANPDKVLSFFETLRSYDWKGVLSGLGEAFMNVAKTIRPVMDFLFSFGGGKLGKLLVYGNLLGRFLQLFGGGLKGFSYPVAAIATLVKRLSHLGGLGKILKLGIFAKLAGKAGTIVKGIKGAEAVATAAAPAMTKWGALAKFGTATQIAASGLAIKQVLEGVAEISKVDIPPNAKWMLYRAAGVITAMTGLSSLAGKFLLSNPYAALGTGVTGLVGYGFAKGISEILSSVKPLADGLKTLQELKPIKKGSFSKVAKSVEDIAPDIKKMYKALGKALPKKKPVSFADAQKGKDSVAKDVKDMLDAIKSVADIGLLVDELAKIKLSEKKIEKAKGSITKIGEVIGSLKEDIANIFGEETYLPDRGKSQGGKRTGRWTKSKFDSSSLQEYAEATGFFQEALTNLTGIVTAVSSFQKQFDKVAGDIFTKGKDGYDSTAIQEKIDGIRTFLNSTMTTDMGLTLKGATKNLKDVDTTAIAGAFTGLVSIIKEMYKVQTTLESLSTGESPFDAEGLNAELGKLGMAIGNLGTVLTNVEFNADSLLTLDNIQRAFVKLKAIADQIDTVGVDGAIAKIEEAVNKIKAVDWSGMNIPPIDIKVQINLLPMPISTMPVVTAAASAIGAAKTLIDGLNADIKKKVNVKLSPNVTGKDSVVQAVRDAISSIRTSVANLPSEINKTVTVRITRNTIGSAHGPGFSTGGYVGGERPLYRASGGSIFKPKGTDTVPAMLTPGEYVNKRAVVNKLGIPFFQRLNNLDIPGALRELSIRTGMKLGSGTTINNYNTTTNNLTNNISVPMSESESRGFTMRKMGRFAGAL